MSLDVQLTGGVLTQAEIMCVLILLGEAVELHWLYTDPGSGLLIWQLLAGAVLGAAFYGRRVLTWLRSKFRG